VGNACRRTPRSWATPADHRANEEIGEPLKQWNPGELRFRFKIVVPANNVRLPAGSWPFKFPERPATPHPGVFRIHKGIAMSVSGLSSTSLFSYAAESVQNQRQQFGKEFEQFGKDLQAGNLSAAQADFAAIQQLKSSSSTSSTQNKNALQADFAQLSNDLQAGNTSAAQQDYANIVQDMQNQASQVHRHHHHHGGQGDNAIDQSLQQLGQALQANDLSTAQQAYATLQQEFQEMQPQNKATGSSNANSFSVKA